MHEFVNELDKCRAKGRLQLRSGAMFLGLGCVDGSCSVCGADWWFVHSAN